MSLQNLTIKSQEILQQAQQLAFTAGNSNIETEHILKTMLDDKDSPVEYLLKKNNVNVNYVDEKLDAAIEKLPKISGGEPAQSLSREGNNVLLRATSTLKTFKDEFVSVEHLLLAMLQGTDNTSKLLKDAGLTEQGLITAIKDLKRALPYLPKLPKRNSMLSINTQRI
ncbi:MAG: Clp protease N-terminal domain-containing protein [Ferruginibacter sp.]